MKSEQSRGPLPLLIGVTGHRNLRGEDIPALEQEVRQVFQELQKRYPHTSLTLISPLAEGADRLVARVAAPLGVRLHVLFPMPRSLYLSDFTSEASRGQLEQLLAQAEQIFELPVAEGSNPEDVRQPGPAR